MNIETLNEKEELSRELYNHWISQPLTAKFKQLLLAHRENLIGAMTARVTSADLPDSVFRQDAAAIKTVETIIKTLTSYTTFTQNTTKQ